MGDRHPTLQILSMLFGFLAWAAHFTFVYVFAALACARGFAGIAWAGFGIVPLAISGATLAAVLAIAIHAAASLRRRPNGGSRFLRGLGIWVDGLGLVAVVMAAATVIVPECT